MKRRWWILIVAGCALLAGFLMVPGPDRKAEKAAWQEAAELTSAGRTKPFEPVTEGASALVLYDDKGEFAFLGELYGMMLTNLAGRFGTVRTEPISAYKAGEIASHTATFYLGTTYLEKPGDLPQAFLTEVLSSSRPVVWFNDNIWHLATKAGASFTERFGWDPAKSTFFTASPVTSVSYKERSLPRTVVAGGSGVLRPVVTDPKKAVTVAEASADNGDRFPWALRSGNLTYIGEVPFDSAVEGDRSVVLADLMYDALAPEAPERHRALLRLEDINPDTSPDTVRALAEYLNGAQIPYTFEVVPFFVDGKADKRTPLTERPELVSVLKYMAEHGGVPDMHGYTHQYKDVNNPYDSVTGNDFEFYRAHIDASDNVVFEGPVAEDSAEWARDRVTRGREELTKAGLKAPLWTTPHYAASATDYKVFREEFGARYERPLLFPGFYRGKPDPAKAQGQFLPYPVKDVYGGVLIPENLGNYIPKGYNNHSARTPGQIVESAEANLVVRDGFASFFYHGYLDVEHLKETVEGIRKLGYTFVSPLSLVRQ
ncbi:polysaccharide deacetylase family protein [Actinocorallia longicatena]|uniref:Polysaccharide deacetylase family protein n=1 Tax=Actinocorallia longicatena TaxID=111803 RepID=A0ABP6QFJ6_9ACTN